MEGEQVFQHPLCNGNVKLQNEEISSNWQLISPKNRFCSIAKLHNIVGWLMIKAPWLLILAYDLGHITSLKYIIIQIEM